MEINHDTCRSRSDIRSAKDIYKISTSSLSKKELEDLYYSSFNSNLELKKTVNSQRDQIKVLTTRISRLTQKNIYSPQKGCSINTLNEYKEIIIELKHANEKLVERVRLLNMQLCSAKQFVRSKPLLTSRCQNCAKIRNSSSITLLNTKRSQPNLRTKSTASQYEHDITPIILEETIKNDVPTKDQEECTQNKCRTAIGELQLKIQDLEKELSNFIEHQKNEIRKETDYDNVLSSLKEDNLRVRTRARICEEKLDIQKREYLELLKKLRSVEGQSETVALELILEKQKTRELETQLKSAEISNKIIQALSQTMRANESNEPVTESLMPVRVDESVESMREDESLKSVRVGETLTPTTESRASARTKSLIPVKVNESLVPVGDESTEKLGESPSKVEQSDDSGYLEATNKFIEQGCGDIKLDKIHEEPKDERINTSSVDFRREKRRGKTRRNKRDSSLESSIDENLSRISSTDVSETRIDKDNRAIEHYRQPKKNMDVSKRIFKDIGVQNSAEYVSRAVGDAVARTDAEVQIGDSLCAMPDIDTRTYSRKSNRTYSVRAASPAPPAPATPLAPATPPAPAALADNTEREISSLSDLPSERECTPSDYISPGEAVTSSDYTTWSDLSEGELPMTRHRSYGEVDTSIGEQKPSISPERLNRATRAAKEEADRIARLLEGRPVDLPGGTVNPLVLLRERYQKT